MTFVQTTFLAATAAIAIPILVHLLSRRQERRIELGTIKFLHDVIQDGSQTRRLRRWLLLAVRSLIMLLLAFLFARPYLVDSLTRRTGNHQRIILIDRSASMNMKGNSGRLVDDAVVEAIKAGDEAIAGTTVVYAWFDRHVQPLSAGNKQPVAPRTAGGSTDYAAAISWAKTAVDAHPGNAADVVMISDFQRNGLRQRIADVATESFPSDVPMQLVDVGREAVNNLAIAGLESTSERIIPGNDFLLDVTLINYGSLPYEEVSTKAVAFDGNKSIRLRKSINIAAGEASEVQFDFGKLKPALWQVTVSIDVDDDLVADNQRLTAVEVAAPARTIVIDDSAEQAIPTSYYLMTALSQDTGHSFSQKDANGDATKSATGLSRFAPEVIGPGSGSVGLISPNEVPLTVIADAGAIRSPVLTQLSQYVKHGGRLLVFSGNIDAAERKDWRQTRLAPGQISSSIRSGTMPFRIVNIDASQQMMAPFSDPQHADLSRLSFRQLLPVQPDSRTHVLATFGENRPAITRHSLGAGTVVWFSSSADSAWGNWTASPLYLPLVQQMAADLLNLTGEGHIRFRHIGDDRDDVLTSAAPSKSWTLVSNPGAGAAATAPGLPSEKDSDDQKTLSLPVYQSPGFEQSADALYVVNCESQESDPARIDASSFAKHFGLTIGSSSGSNEDRTISIQKKVEYWPWLAGLLFVLVFAEFSLSNRTTA